MVLTLGSTLVTFVSKSGTNAFHGSAYEFLRNQKLDARGFFAAKKAVYKQNDFGFTAGGPVWIPRLYHGRDKTFFFVSCEGFRNRVGAPATPISVAPPEFYTGDRRNSEWASPGNCRDSVRSFSGSFRGSWHNWEQFQVWLGVTG